MCFELCPLDYRPPVVIHQTIPLAKERVVPGYGRFLNAYNTRLVAPLSGQRFGQHYSAPRGLHQGITYASPVIAPGLNSRVTTSVPTANGRAVPGYGNVVHVRRGI